MCLRGAYQRYHYTKPLGGIARNLKLFFHGQENRWACSTGAGGAVRQRNQLPVGDQCVVELDVTLEAADLEFGAVDLVLADFVVLAGALIEFLDGDQRLREGPLVRFLRAFEARHGAVLQRLHVLLCGLERGTKELRQPLLVAFARELVRQERATEAASDAVAAVVVFRHLVAVVNHLLFGGEFLAILADGADARVCDLFRDLGGGLVGHVRLAALLDDRLELLQELEQFIDLLQSHDVVHHPEGDVGEVEFAEAAGQLRGLVHAESVTDVVAGVRRRQFAANIAGDRAVSGDMLRVLTARRDIRLRVQEFLVVDFASGQSSFKGLNGGEEAVALREGGTDVRGAESRRDFVCVNHTPYYTPKLVEIARNLGIIWYDRPTPRTRPTTGSP